MVQLQVSLAQMEEKDPIHYSRAIQDLFIQLLLVLWEILYFPLQQIQQVRLSSLSTLSLSLHQTTL